MKSRNIFIFVCLAAFAQCTTWGFLRVVACISTLLLFSRATPLQRCTIFCLTQGLSPLPLLPRGPDTSRLLYHRMVSGLPSLKPTGAHSIPFSHWDKQKCIQLPNVSLESKTTPGWEYWLIHPPKWWTSWWSPVFSYWEHSCLSVTLPFIALMIHSFPVSN